MKCPLCGSEIVAGSKYCPTCGADVEAARMRAQQTAATQASARQTMQMPVSAQASQNRRAAVPMNSSMPQQQPQGMRSFDTSKMNGTPKWPIVLIVLLALVIIVALVLIFVRPWESPTTTPSQGSTSAVETSSASDDSTVSDAAEPTDTTGTVEPTDTAEPAAATVGLSDADAYTQLSTLYDSLPGLNDSIVGVVNNYFNNDPVYLTGDLATRQAALADTQGVQSSIDNGLAQLNAMVLAEGSSYSETLETMKTLYNDLSQRIRVLAEALQTSVDAGDDPSSVQDQISSILTADNGSDGVNVYKAEYESLYPGAAPAAPAEA